MSGRKVFLEITNLTKGYCINTGMIRGTRVHRLAVNNISLNIFTGECLALVGETGSGKTTLGRCILRLVRADHGSVIHNGVDLLQVPEKEFRHLRPKFQMIYQNHTQTLNPRQSVAACLKEPLKVHGQHRKEALRSRVDELLSMVRLRAELLTRFPNELSGGQRQRVAMARALATSPSFIIADEPTSSLDAPIKRQIIELLTDLQHRLGLTLLLISHDLAMVSNVSDRIAVMYCGTVVEVAPTTLLINSPLHPYSKLLVQSASYQISDDLLRDCGEKSNWDVPKVGNTGCAYSDRCPWAETTCFDDNPTLRNMGGEHFVACHLAGKVNFNQTRPNRNQNFTKLWKFSKVILAFISERMTAVMSPS
ncbi:MAG: oligopeptide/dipeptide ABC transporter ATP-binding protein [bacterium]